MNGFIRVPITILLAAFIAAGSLSAQGSPEDKAAKKAAEEARLAAKNVWQKAHKKGAVEDQHMILNTEKEPDLSSGFVSIFDGKTLGGWHIACGGAAFEVEDGAIVGTKNPEDKVNTFLVTDRNDYKNFVVTLEYKWIEKGNSGLMVLARLDRKGLVAGPQVEIETNDNRRWTGGLYGERDGAWKYSLSREDHEQARQAVQNHSDWNRLTVEVKDGVLKSWVNGVPCANFNLSADKNLKKYEEGFIGLQVHNGKHGITAFRNIKIKELKASK